MKLNAYIAHAGVCSRRKAAVLVKDGKVRLNGKIVIEPWIEISNDDRVLVNNRPVLTARFVYIVFNKPRGVTTTLEDKFAEKMVIDFIPQDLGRVYPVGRLDKDSRGLLILTNDGDLCHKLTHPRFEVEKEYDILIKGSVEEQTVKGLARGVIDGKEHLAVKSARIVPMGKGGTLIKAIICDGKKRHIRRLFERFGLEVKDLKRVRIGGLKLGDLKTGNFRVIERKKMYGFFPDLSLYPSRPCA